MGESIYVEGLKDTCQLSPVRCADFAEAAAVCLDHHGHPQAVLLAVEGDWEEKFKLSWPDVDQQMRDSRKDMEYTVESGAYCLAMMVIEKLTGLQVVKQSQKERVLITGWGINRRMAYKSWRAWKYPVS